MQRRVFVHLAAYTAAAIAFPLLNGCGSSETATASKPLLFSQLVDVKTIVETGVAYRKTVPAEDEKSKLVNLLLADNHLTASSPTAQIKITLDNLVKDDFKTRKIVTVKGWVLSLTEARQCALFSILHA